MPTHKQFPDSYFDDLKRWRRRTAPARRAHGRTHWGGALIAVCLLVATGLSATGGLATIWRRILGSSSNQAAPAAPLQTSTPGTPGSSGAASTPLRAQRRKHDGRQSILAVGEPLPGSGRSPELQAFGLNDGIVVRSYSPMPVEITFSNGYDSAFTPLASLSSGQSVSQAVTTGTRYGYCFTQTSGAGFLGTRGCGSEAWSETVNGVGLPSGSPLTKSLSFSTW